MSISLFVLQLGEHEFGLWKRLLPEPKRKFSLQGALGTRQCHRITSTRSEITYVMFAHSFLGDPLSKVPDQLLKSLSAVLLSSRSVLI